jgi:hypothetical protein
LEAERPPQQLLGRVGFRFVSEFIQQAGLRLGLELGEDADDFAYLVQSL